MKVYNRQFVARTATTDRVMRTTDREYVHTTVSQNKKLIERDNEMVQLTKIILKQTARHIRLAVMDSDFHSRLQNSRFFLKISKKKVKCGVIVLRARSIKLTR